MPNEPLVGNAGDRQQLERARRVEKERERAEIERFKRLMENQDFRFFMWRLLKKTRVFESVWSPNAQIHYNAGQQDIGHQYMGMVVELTPDLYLTMIKENNDAT